ncbi:MAG: alginate export family protein [Thermodesulfobacteriota bacterium]|jgi:hypothetical protein
MNKLKEFWFLLLEKGIAYPLLFFTFFWFTTFPLLADEDRGRDNGSERKTVVRLGEWEFDFGGQVRLRGDFAKNQNLTDFAFTPGHNEAQLLERTRLQASIENHSLNMEAFFQSQWYGRWGGIDRRSDFDLYQGYLQWEKIFALPVSLKAGRQEFFYGSAFFIGTNDFYNGLTWDGFKTRISPVERLDVDVIGAKMVRLNPGDPDIYLAGLYETYKILKEGSLEAYLFCNKGGFPLSHREFVLVDSGQKWFTLGVRYAGEATEFEYELEPQIQWGEVRNAMNGKDVVRAYGGHVNLGYTFKLPWEPRIFGAYAYGSGDNNPFDGRYREFHGTVFNDDSDLYGDMRILTDQSGVTVERTHASGLQIWVGGLSLKPLSNLNVTVRIHRFLANKVPASFSKDIGTEFDSEISYKLTKGISILVGLDEFYTGRFFREASGSRNVNYFYIQAQADF